MMPTVIDQTVAVPLRLVWVLAAFTLLGLLVALFEATQLCRQLGDWCAYFVRRCLLGSRREW
jgi:hypothetical protein